MIIHKTKDFDDSFNKLPKEETVFFAIGHRKEIYKR
jgi:hypothetical protein